MRARCAACRFGWSNDTVFQAGPSTAMHWFGIAGDGSVTPAGSRGNDTDAMNGECPLSRGCGSEAASLPCTAEVPLLCLNDETS